jgi:hypothetical protein
MEDIVRDLNQLARYAEGLQELFTEFQKAAPEQSAGTDRSGAVQAVLGRDGLPQTVRVQADWKQRLRPDSFAAAVTEAFGAALRERGLRWSQALEHGDWQERSDRLDEDSARAPAGGSGAMPAAFRRPGSGAVPAAFRRPGSAAGRPQPLERLADEAMGLLSEARKQAARASAQPHRGVGSNRGGSLTVTVSPAGQVSCQADPRWVAERSGETLTEELRQALASARRELAAPGLEDAQAELARRQEQLLADIQAVSED